VEQHGHDEDAGKNVVQVLAGCRAKTTAATSPSTPISPLTGGWNVHSPDCQPT
jgi:hypothetical protein